MTKIKVGQIWDLLYNKDNRCVITKINEKKELCLLFTCGLVSQDVELDAMDFEQCRFITEHDTWQEAVNSKEFKGE